MAVQDVFDDNDIPSSNLEFQLFDRDFQEWIDIDYSTSVPNLSKLRAVCHVSRADLLQLADIQPTEGSNVNSGILTTYGSDVTGTSLSSVSSERSNDLEMTPFYQEADDALPAAVEAVTEPQNAISPRNTPGKPMRCQKESIKKLGVQADDKDFDYPYPLPTNFTDDVEVDLARKTMTSRTTATFLTAVAHSMFAKKRYPSRVDFQVVARTVVTTYPFMQSSSGTGQV
jgi:hypothetical protein